MTTYHRECVSINKAAAHASVSRRTIYNWLEAGRLEYQRTAGGSIRIFVDSLFRGPTRPPRPDRG